MSEKVTFRELIESIAEETDNSKQFTHDFLKDFVDVINDGLEQDKKVNIAGFGKFQLRRMDEREGYNPQTEEKITIPAHNKIVFKPYKDLRELVNAPYSHLEAELIEDEEASTSEEAQKSKDTEANEQDDFIPTAPPTSHPSVDKSDDKSKDKADEKAPFEPDDDSEKTEEPASPSVSQQDEEKDADADVVEFNADKKKDNSFSIDNFISSIEPSDSKNAETGEEQTEAEVTDSEEESAAESQNNNNPFGDTEDKKATTDDDLDEFMNSSSDQPEESTHNKDLSADEDEYGTHTDPFAPDFEDAAAKGDYGEAQKEQPATSSAPGQPSRNRRSALPILAAAVIILLLVAAGAWYFMGSSNNSTPQMADNEPASTATITAKDENQEQATDQSETADQSQNQSQASSPNDSAADAQKASSTDLKIEKGQTLWSIAKEKYGNPRLWPWIYGENGSLKDPDLILTGKSLSVPLPSGPQNSLNFADSVGVAKGFIATYNWFRDSDRMKAKNHLWAAKSYHENIRNLTDVNIDKADLSYANQAR